MLARSDALPHIRVQRGVGGDTYVGKVLCGVVPRSTRHDPRTCQRGRFAELTHDAWRFDAST
jgi:hypothetical protein